MTHSTVSVVMGVYNGAADLPTTLDSILAQEGCDFEVMVVDDGSTDDTGAILDAYAARDARLRVIHQENTGLTRALIRGCAEAKGEFIARQDCGDVSLPERLARQVAHLRAHPEQVLVGCDYVLVGPGGEELRTARYSLKVAQRAYQQLCAGELRGVQIPHHGSVMFRKAAYILAGGYRTEFYFAQDLDLWTRLAQCGKLGYAPKTLCRIKHDYHSLSACHMQRQQALHQLIEQATRLRLAGADETPVLTQAQQIRSGAGGAKLADTDYFLGSCLLQRRDARAKRYLARAVRGAPWRLKPWVKLLRAWWLR